MQVISSMLTLQTSFTDNPKTIEILEMCQDRINSMALVHEKIYRTEDLANINFKDYTTTLTESLFNNYNVNNNNIAIEVESEDLFLDIDTAIPLGLIINELVTNALKHAFKQIKEGEVKVSLHTFDKEKIKLIVRDNGAGFPEDFDFNKKKSFGLDIVRILAEQQLGGSITIKRSRGTEFHIILNRAERKSIISRYKN